MADITAAAVKDLREKTGAGMMDCKAALVETKGDIEEAVDWLRKKGLSKAAKKSGRIAAEGAVSLIVAGRKAAVVEVNSETDFVARNQQFQHLARAIAKVAEKVGADVPAILAAPAPDSGTIADAIASAIATIGENITLRRAAVLSVEEGVVGSYIHNLVSEGLGKIGVLVALESTGKSEELFGLGRQIAMHVAATNPLAVDPSGVDGETIARERGILTQKAEAQGKPANMIDKIVESGLKSYFKEVCLLDQPFVVDPSKSVGQALKEAEGRVGAPVTLKAFLRFALGEGIEKQTNDFAAEVAAVAGTR